MQKRLSFEDGLSLFQTASLKELQQRAVEIRNQKNPSNRVTFVLDSNPNYTNVCNVDCKFCAFYRRPSAKDAYTKNVDEVMVHLKRAKEAGLTTVLLQGGVNETLTIDYYTSLVRAAREQFPEIHPHFFTAVELVECARVSNISLREVFEKLWDAGARTLPGGGAEVLSERVRLEISPKKLKENGWAEAHQIAHQVGFRSTATMMYGHVEEPYDILLHLETIRQIQDKTGGFTAFIPWSYKRERTALRRTVKHWAGSDAYFRMLSFARIYLDNFDHIGASWFGEGKENGIKALQYGADDFGGTILEENVHRATGWVNRVDHNGMLEMIRAAGFEPAQRDTLYNILRTYEGVESVEIPDAQKVDEQDCLPALEKLVTLNIVDSI